MVSVWGHFWCSWAPPWELKLSGLPSGGTSADQREHTRGRHTYICSTEHDFSDSGCDLITACLSCKGFTQTAPTPTLSTPLYVTDAAFRKLHRHIARAWPKSRLDHYNSHNIIRCRIQQIRRANIITHPCSQVVRVSLYSHPPPITTPGIKGVPKRRNIGLSP